MPPELTFVFSYVLFKALHADVTFILLLCQTELIIVPLCLFIFLLTCHYKCSVSILINGASVKHLILFYQQKTLFRINNHFF